MRLPDVPGILDADEVSATVETIAEKTMEENTKG